MDEVQVVVADNENNRAKTFTHGGKFEFDIKLDRPFDVTLSQTGHLYLTSGGDKCVQVFSAKGHKVTTMGQGQLDTPLGITLNRQGHVMVCDGEEKFIFTFHPDSGELLNTIPLSMCEYPRYITVNSSNDNIVISDWWEHCVHVLSPTGDQLYQYGTEGSGDDQLAAPSGVCTDRYGHIFIADCNNHRIVALSPRGKFIRYIATEDDGLESPKALAISPAGMLVVAEADGKVKKFQYLQ
ncbi:tripartite motif-containing protein 3-like [Lingula anatina]|uniref:Tripartite motif-containing protein 3-like n=1 Tax=Lingula anatina TaxID=7574 RepID=A0A1S3JIC6_LINAN|nr:tripartite motif-containing protein 3-like [Lingula anatina]|eukprot:XP_013410118.1 tripartite motif-containing protein 3-like [Lingula anatina]